MIRLTNIKNTILLSLLVLTNVNSVNASSFYFEPSTQAFSNCKNTIALMIDTTGESSNSADIEIFYDQSKIEIIDANPSSPGIQIREGDAYSRYWGNITFPDSGQIFLAGGSLPDNGITLEEERVFGYVDFNFIGEPGDSTIFAIRMDSIGNTLDSNIASSIDGADMLISRTDGNYIFNTPENCKSKRKNPILLDLLQDIFTPKTETPEDVEDISREQDSITETISPPRNEQTNYHFLRFSNPDFSKSNILTEQDIYISSGLLLGGISFQVGIMIFLFIRRHQIHHVMIKKAVFINATSKLMKRKKISYNKILNLK